MPDNEGKLGLRVLKTYVEGDKSMALCQCERAKGWVNTTFKTRDVPLSDGSCTVNGVLVSTCDLCDWVVATPPQSTPVINAAIEAHHATLPKTAYFGIDGRSAINSQGETFLIGETVKHQGAGDEVAVIEGFTHDPKNADIVVQTSKGTCTIEFLLKV
jgi:hypothetical protein